MEATATLDRIEYVVVISIGLFLKFNLTATKVFGADY